jgi:hypothetical protein
MASRRYGLDEGERSLIYKLLWLGVPASLLFLGGQFFDLAPFDVIGGGFCAGLLIGLPGATSHDEYVRAQADIAARWALAAAGLMLVVNLPGFEVLTPGTPLALAVIAVTFNAALAWQRIGKS